LGEARLLRQVLPDQPVGVLVGPTLPGVVRGGEVELNTGGFLDLLVAVELRAVVGGDRLEPVPLLPDELDGAGGGVRRAVTLELAHLQVACSAFDDGQRTVPSVVIAHHRVDLPWARDLSALDLGWALGYVPLTCESSSAVVVAAALAALLGRLAHVSPQIPAGRLVVPHAQVDRLVADGTAGRAA